MITQLSNHFARLRPLMLRVPEPGDFIKFPYGVPAGIHKHLWDWDAFFISLHLSQRPDNPQPEYFQYWVRNFASAYEELGYATGWISSTLPDHEHRHIDLKPFMAQAALLGSSHGGFDWLAPLYDTICEIVTRREADNRDAKTGLYYWDDAVQSGADNNAADSNLPEIKTLFLSCDLNSLQWQEYNALSEIAAALGHDGDHTKFKSQANALKKAINEHLWNEEQQVYDNRRRDTGMFVNCISWTNFFPLWAGLASQERASAMINKFLLNEEHLMSQWGARSLSRQDRVYNNAVMVIPYSNWRGPIWGVTNYIYHQGLIKYGFTSEARELAERIAKLFLDDLDQIGSMHENYCSETGKPLAPSADDELGISEGGFIGWNLLALDMLEQSSN